MSQKIKGSMTLSTDGWFVVTVDGLERVRARTANEAGDKALYFGVCDIVSHDYTIDHTGVRP